MHSFFMYMNNPQIVANFQKIFGLEWEFDEHKNKIEDNKKIGHKILTKLDGNNNALRGNRNADLRSRKLDCNNNFHVNESSVQYNTQSSDSSSTSTDSSDHVVRNTDHSHLVSKTKINIKFW